MHVALLTLYFFWKSLPKTVPFTKLSDAKVDLFGKHYLPVYPVIMGKFPNGKEMGQNIFYTQNIMWSYISRMHL